MWWIIGSVAVIAVVWFAVEIKNAPLIEDPEDWNDPNNWGA